MLKQLARKGTRLDCSEDGVAAQWRNSGRDGLFAQVLPRRQRGSSTCRSTVRSGKSLQLRVQLLIKLSDRY